MDTLLKKRAAMMVQLSNVHSELLRVTAGDELCRPFMTIPGDGPVTALALKTPVDDPARF
jgi:transposase